MKLATVEFRLVETDVPDVPGSTSKYIECHMIYPPVDYVVGIGVSLAESFDNLQARVLDSAVLGARAVYEQAQEQEHEQEQAVSAGLENET